MGGAMIRTVRFDDRLALVLIMVNRSKFSSLSLGVFRGMDLRGRSKASPINNTRKELQRLSCFLIARTFDLFLLLGRISC
jgi:hypothetical protein